MRSAGAELSNTGTASCSRTVRYRDSQLQQNCPIQGQPAAAELSNTGRASCSRTVQYRDSQLQQNCPIQDQPVAAELPNTGTAICSRIFQYMDSQLQLHKDQCKTIHLTSRCYATSHICCFSFTQINIYYWTALVQSHCAPTKICPLFLRTDQRGRCDRIRSTQR